MIRYCFATLIAALPSLAFSHPAADRHIGKSDCLVLDPIPLTNASFSWSGGCKEGYADGDGVAIWTLNGKQVLRYEGGMRRGKRHGPSAEQDAGGNIAWGDFIDGKRHGQTHVEDGKGYVRDTEYDHGEIKGPVSIRYHTGHRYTGGWSEQGPEGHGVMVYPLGGTYAGLWKAGSKAGGVITYPNREQRTVPPSLPAPRAAGDTEGNKTGRYSLGYGMESLYFLNRIASGSVVPFHKAYRDMTPEEQHTVRGWFNILGEDDVPPYPVGGTAEIIKAAKSANWEFGQHGELLMDVLVDEQGHPQDVIIRQTPGKGVGEFMAGVLLLTRYTPAKCAGKPCALRFPVWLDLRAVGQ